MIPHSIIFYCLILISAHCVTGAVFKDVNLSDTSPTSSDNVFDEFNKPFLSADNLKIYGKIGEPLTLTCKIHGYPRPKVEWKRRDGTTVPGEVSIQDLPFDYISKITIDKVQEDTSYTCHATNEAGSNEITFDISTKKLNKFQVYASENVNIWYEGKGMLTCKVVADVPAIITWYKVRNNNTSSKQLSSNENIEISEDNSVVTIKRATLSDDGFYICDVQFKYNGIILDSSRISSLIKVTINGVEKPEIDKNKSKIEITKASDVTNTTIHCSILKGVPKPAITWFHHKSTNEAEIFEVDEWKDKQSVVVFIRDYNDAGQFTCQAKNALGTDHHTTNIEYRPTIKVSNSSIIDEPGASIEIPCVADGSPKPTVTWYKGHEEITSNDEYEITENGLRFTANISFSGVYTCKAFNKLDSVKKTVNVTIIIPAFVKGTTPTYFTPENGTSLELKCEVGGYPEPSLLWEYSNYSGIFENISHDGAVLQLTALKYSERGLYRCSASNEYGSASITFDVDVGTRPTINQPTEPKMAVEGKTLEIVCEASGLPKPIVTWTMTPEMKMDSRYRQENDTLIVSNVKKSDTGEYNCTAHNVINSAEATYQVIVQVPAKIKTPSTTEIYPVEGAGQELECEASGDPEPVIQWYHNRNISDGSLGSLTIGPKANNGKLVLEKFQRTDEGTYTCVASNNITSEEPAKLIYTVLLGVPAYINKTSNESIVAVDGDVAINIHCESYGNPKPTTTWMKDGVAINESDSTYVIENQHLTVLNVTMESEGEYTCKAANILKEAQGNYTVEVYKYAPLTEPTEKRVCTVSNPLEVECPVSGDTVRWFKDGEEEISMDSNSLIIVDATVEDTGSYTCRVSNLTKSISSTFEVIVGKEPRILKGTEEINVEMNEKMDRNLDCANEGNPTPTVQWYYDGKLLNETNSTYTIPTWDPTNGSIAFGKYKCVVKNDFKNISKTFNVFPKECYIDTTKLTKLHPLIRTLKHEFPLFTSPINGYMVLKPITYELVCPSKFRTFNKDTVTAFCHGGYNFIIKNNVYNFFDLQCNEEITHTLKKTNAPCLTGDTETVKIQYKLLKYDTEVYEVCLNKISNTPIYTKFSMQNSVERREGEPWSDSQFENNFGVAYDCEGKERTSTEEGSETPKDKMSTSTEAGMEETDNELNYNSTEDDSDTSSYPYDKMSTSTEPGKDALEVKKSTITPELRSSEREDELCLSRRQLVNPSDVFPGAPPSSTYSYINVVPQWTTNARNWAEIEQRVRNFRKRIDVRNSLVVWTGIAQVDKNEENESIPKFLWKILQYNSSGTSLAIVQVNIPDLQPSDVAKYVLCPDVCNNYNWLQSSDWHDVKKGYTYCCSVENFKNAFEFKDLIVPGSNKLIPNNILELDD